jgi:hypothetical protein
MEQYLRDYYKKDILKILKSPKKAKIHEILLDLTALKENGSEFFNQLIKSTEYNKIANKWMKAIKNVQQELKDEMMSNLNPSISVPNKSQLDVSSGNYSSASTNLLDVVCLLY